ncbi:MAG: hypothetical protein L0212_09785 [Acidobacteria bacterium]|nr:hypothetical protein [Acidobacteriota bacterium]
MVLAATESELQQRLSDATFAGMYGFRLYSIADGECTLEVPFQAIIRRPTAANALSRLLRRRQPLADLLLGVIGDLVPPRALLSIDAVKQLLL